MDRSGDRAARDEDGGLGGRLEEGNDGGGGGDGDRGGDGVEQGSLAATAWSKAAWRRRRRRGAAGS